MISPDPRSLIAVVAPGEGGGTVSILIGLFILFVAAKIGEEIARRLRQPAVVGELLGGFVVGPHALALVTPGESALVLAEIGVVVLLFGVGLEVRVDDLLAVGREAAVTAAVAMILPIVFGAGLAILIGEEPSGAAFIGLAMAATSIGITSRVLGDLGVLERTYARIILAAAVIDDVLALVAIGIVSGVTAGDLSASTVLLAVVAVGLVGLGLAAARRARGLPREVFTWPLFAETPLVPAFILMFGFALFGALFGLAAIIGAFVAGLIVAETEARDELESEIRPLRQVFTPFFFAVTGAQLDLGALRDPVVLSLALGLALIGVIAKSAGGVVGARSVGRWSALTVGFGMVPRGEVGIVVATIGLVGGVLSDEIFSAVLVAVVLTTLVAPYLLQYSVPRAEAEERLRATSDAARTGAEATSR